ncbi:hypothetical protein JCM9279_004908 [Rhodotorula babjevae]
MASAVASTSTAVLSSPSSSSPPRPRTRTLRLKASDDDSDYRPAEQHNLVTTDDDDDNDSAASYHDDDDDDPSVQLDSDDDSDLFSDGADSKPRKRRYKCSWPGCSRSYVRPVRLEEHERSHTGERPFACPECDATFARDSHLKAHVRTHAPESDKPFACDEDGCDKRFWTAQHLKSHVDVVHLGLVDAVKTYDCSHCGKVFRKHRLLNEHLTVAHGVPAVKPLACPHPGCGKTFQQKHHLKSHEKTHDLSRYACLHPDCASKPFAERQFGVWSALQKHTKAAHPPRCHYPQCAGKTFTTTFGLRTHLKLHAADEEAGLEGLPEGRQRRSRMRTRQRARGGRGRRRDKGKGKETSEGGEGAGDGESGSEGGSEWEDRQEAERDERMREAFRHGGKKKRKVLEEAHGFPPIPPSTASPASTFYRDLVSGAHYAHASNPSASAGQPQRKSAPASRAASVGKGDDRPRPGLLHVPRQYACPFPAILALPFDKVKVGRPTRIEAAATAPAADVDDEDEVEGTCRFWFKRVYDVERHLRSRHGVEMVGGRDTLDTWFEAQKEAEETAEER